MRKLIAVPILAVLALFATAGVAFAWSNAATVSGVQSSTCESGITVTWTISGTDNDTGYALASLATTGVTPSSTSPSPLGTTLIQSGSHSHSTDTVTVRYPNSASGQTVGLTATVHGWFSDSSLHHSVDDGTYVYSGSLHLAGSTDCETTTTTTPPTTTPPTTTPPTTVPVPPSTTVPPVVTTVPPTTIPVGCAENDNGTAPVLVCPPVSVPPSSPPKVSNPLPVTAPAPALAFTGMNVWPLVGAGSGLLLIGLGLLGLSRRQRLAYVRRNR